MNLFSLILELNRRGQSVEVIVDPVYNEICSMQEEIDNQFQTHSDEIYYWFYTAPQTNDFPHWVKRNVPIQYQPMVMVLNRDEHIDQMIYDLIEEDL